MTVLPHLAARLFGVPLAIHRPKLDVIVSVLGARIGVTDHDAPLPSAPPLRAYGAHPPHIAVIPIHGTLVRRTVGLEASSGLTSYLALADQLDAALANPQVRAILLDVDSPGGESGGVFDLADRVRAATRTKPVWAVANDQAFSAAYALASAATRVFVARTGGAGSVGVIALHADHSVKDAKDGIRYTPVFAGARKNDLSPHEPITDAAHAILSREVERVFGLFVDTVAKHRGLSADQVRAWDAGLFFGADAVSAGLADAVASFDDALAQLTASLSLPTPTSGAPGLARSLLSESSMSAETEPVAAVVADSANAPAPAVSASAFGVVDSLEIAQICTLAGRPHLIAGFLETQTAPDAVRRHLLAALADDSPEIASRIAPDAQAPSAAASNPLIDAARKLAATATATAGGH